MIGLGRLRQLVEGAAQQLLRLVEAPLAEAESAEKMQHVEVLGMGAQHRLVAEGGVVEAALAMERQGFFQAGRQARRCR